jgi:hypothetical protein
VLGAAGFVLGQAGRGSRRATGGWYALGAIVVGVAAVVLNLLASCWIASPRCSKFAEHLLRCGVNKGGSSSA